MLYLAEVKNQTKGFVGGYKTDLKLLAVQENDQIWNSTSKPDITVSEINDQVSKGTLYVINMGPNGQIQGNPELAGNRMVNYLKHFARILEKSKSQEEEIEQWKLSLKIQSEEISNRLVELDTQQAEIKEKESQFAKLEQDKNKLYELQKHLAEEQQRFQDSGFGKGENVDKIKELIHKFSDSIIDSNSLREYCEKTLDLVNKQQSILDPYWQKLEQERNQLEGEKNHVNQQGENIHKRKEEFNASLKELQKAQQDLEIQKNTIANKEETLGQISLYLVEIFALKEEISDLSGDGGDGEGDNKIDLNILENKPLGELEDIVKRIKDETAKVFNFVNMQEEELTLQGDYVNEIAVKLSQASEIDKLDLDEELADAKEAMRLLDETLVGQRRNLKKQQKLLNEHIKILNRRKGVFDVESFDEIDFEPILKNLDRKINTTEETKNQLESEINYLKESLGQIQEMINQQVHNNQTQEQKLQQEEDTWLESKFNVLKMESRIDLLDEQLHPLQNELNSFRDSLQNMQEFMNNVQNNFDTQRDLVSEAQSILES